MEESLKARIMLAMNKDGNILTSVNIGDVRPSELAMIIEHLEVIVFDLRIGKFKNSMKKIENG